MGGDVMHKVVKPSMVDSLADQLSRLTGTTFEVVRDRRSYSSSGMQDTVITRYHLRATRLDYSHVFGGSRGMTINEMKYYLASLCDMRYADDGIRTCEGRGQVTDLSNLQLFVLGLCVLLVLLPPEYDPAIRIKEWQIKQGQHPESPERRGKRR
jgi:hypothetical protein